MRLLSTYEEPTKLVLGAMDERFGGYDGDVHRSLVGMFLFLGVFFDSINTLQRHFLPALLLLTVMWHRKCSSLACTPRPVMSGVWA